MTPRLALWIAVPAVVALAAMALLAGSDASARAPAPASKASVRSIAATSPAPSTAQADPAANASLPAAAAASGEDFPGVFTTPLRYGEGVEFPEDVALVVETGCWGCDGPTEGLYRVYRPIGGEVQVTRIFGPGSFGPGEYTSYAMTPDATQIVVAVCTRGYCGGLGDPSRDAQATFHYSGDGGTTWTNLGTRGDAHFVTAITDAGILLNSQWGSARTLAVNGRPVVTDERTHLVRSTERSGQLILWDEVARRVENGRQEVLFSLPDADRYGPSTVAVNPQQPSIAVWSPPIDRTLGVDYFPGYYVTTRAQDGSQVGIRSNTWVHPAAWLADDLIAATVERFNDGPAMRLLNPNTMRPSLVEFSTGVAHPIRDVFDAAPFAGQRNLVQAALRGAAARSLGQPCVPVRDRWAVTAALVQCAAPSVLRQTGELRYANAQEWRSVALPDGRTGWVLANALTR